MPGQEFCRRYTLDRILGKGGMGIVWLAWDQQLERNVALKFLSSQIIHDVAVFADLKRETKRSLELTHPHIVRIHDFVQDGERACISMEFVDGETLSALRIKKSTNVFDTPDLEPWLADWCQAMHYAHTRARIVHCDLKPSNLMVNSKKALKITDFGIARSLSESMSTLTMVRGKSGTLVYMSPQQLNGEPPSVMDDIYSMGATLYELLTSKPPFYRGQIDRQIFDKVPPSIADRREELIIKSPFIVPLHWEETIAACLAKEPNDRPQGAAEIFMRLSLVSPLQVDRRPLQPQETRGAMPPPPISARIESPKRWGINLEAFPRARLLFRDFWQSRLRWPLLGLLLAIGLAVVITHYLANKTFTKEPSASKTASEAIPSPGPIHNVNGFLRSLHPSPERLASSTPTPSTSITVPNDTTTAIKPTKAELESMYNKAFTEFQANNYTDALKELDAIDIRQPGLSESHNLRGVILMRQGKYKDAEAIFEKALANNPKFWNAKFNLAEIPFLSRQWSEARKRFEDLLQSGGAVLKEETSQLIQYKIMLTFLMEGNTRMVDTFLAQLQMLPETPAAYYAKAARSLERKNFKDANDWLSRAKKTFTPQTNELYAQALYEIGWIQQPSGQKRSALELSTDADRQAKGSALAASKSEEAEQALTRRDLNRARRLVAEAEAANPNEPKTINLRGLILLAQTDYGAAEDAFKEASRIDPTYRDALFNLAQVPFKRAQYDKARTRLEALLRKPDLANNKSEATVMTRFMIYLTLLLDGKDNSAEKMMKDLQTIRGSPAFEYAQAAWHFKHSNLAKANDWIVSARKLYSPAANSLFADPFYDLGWLQYK